MLRFFKRKNDYAAESDEELLQRYRQTGQSRYLGDLYSRYIAMVYGVCLDVLGDAQAAEDAAMGVYQELERKAPQHEIQQFRGWLYVLTRNYCLMELRRQKRNPTEAFDPLDLGKLRFSANNPDAMEPEEKEALLTDLERCLETLTAVQRRCLNLFYYEDKSYREIAEMCREELGMVRSHIQNGRRNLKKCMGKYTT